MSHAIDVKHRDVYPQADNVLKIQPRANRHGAFACPWRALSRIFTLFKEYTGNRADKPGHGGQGMKSVVYLDILLLSNFLIAWFFLLATGRLTGLHAGFGRLLAGALLAALSALILFAPPLPRAAQLAYKLGTALACVGTAYGVRPWRRLAAATVWFASFNMLLAGFALLYIERTGSLAVETANLSVYIRVSPLLLVCLAALCSLAAALLQWLLGTPNPAPQAAGFEFPLCGTVLRVRAMLDTGCALKDPLTCLPVLLVSYPDARARLPAEAAAFLESWFDGQNSQPPPGTSLRLIPCTTASGQTLLPAFAVEGVGLITRRGVQALGQAAVAFSPQSLGGQAYEALYGRDLVPHGPWQMPNEEERSSWE